jgi:hypothetical protein
MLSFIKKENNRKRKSFSLDENNNEVSKRSRLSDNDENEIDSSAIEMIYDNLNESEKNLESFRLEKGNIFEMESCQLACSTSYYFFLFKKNKL